MWLLVGLGNPGDEYANTRHNVGFQVADELARRHRLSFGRTKFRAAAATGAIDGTRVVLLKPRTFMNDSGWAVRRAADFYQVEPPRVFVLYDDLDLPLGKLRIRESGSAGGHNGVRSIIDHLHSDAFPRLKVGIGRPYRERGAVDHVLAPFTAEERPVIEESIGRAADAVELALKEDVRAAMNRFNG